MGYIFAGFSNRGGGTRKSAIPPLMAFFKTDPPTWGFEVPTPHQRSANCPHPIFTEVLHTYHPFPLNLIHILAVLTILLSKNLNFIGYNEKFEISVDISLINQSAPSPPHRDFWTAPPPTAAQPTLSFSANCPSPQRPRGIPCFALFLP